LKSTIEKRTSRVSLLVDCGEFKAWFTQSAK